MSVRKGRRVEPGEFYRRAEGNALVPADPGVPDVVMCRRVADFPGAIPASGAVVPCAACAAPVVTNLAQFPTQPRHCMQCCGVRPLPFEGAS